MGARFAALGGLSQRKRYCREIGRFVILSGATASRSEVVAESKAPYPSIALALIRLSQALAAIPLRNLRRSKTGVSIAEKMNIIALIPGYVHKYIAIAIGTIKNIEHFAEL